MTRMELLDNLKRLNINEAIADRNESADGSPAILLRRDGDEHYYTGFGSAWRAPVEIEESLKARFGDK